MIDLQDAHLGRMAFVMIKNVFPNPDNIGFFGAAGIMFEAKSFAILVQEFLGSWLIIYGYSRVRL